MEELIIKLFNKCLEPLIESFLEKTLSNLTYGKLVMNVAEVADYLNVSESWIYKNVNNSPVFRIGTDLIKRTLTNGD